MTKTTPPVDLLLVVPPGGYYAERWQKGSLMPPLGIGYIAAAAEQAGFHAQILDAYLENMSLKALTQELQRIRPLVVGFTFTTENRFEAFKAIKAAKQAVPESLIIAGGPHASLAAEDTLTHIPELDLIVRGEGEITITELLQALREGSPLDDVKGILFRRNGEIIQTKPQALIQDLDALPFPARHLYALDRYNFVFDVPGYGSRKFVNLMTSRGCPFKCVFCASQMLWGSRCRLRSAESVLAEIKEIVEVHKAEALWIFDDTFNSNPKRVEQICDGIIEQGWKLPWFCEVRLDMMSRDLLKKMKEAGCYCIGFGVESGSQRLLDEVIGKHLQLERFHEVMQWCEEIGVLPNPFFIVSHPTETVEDARKTMELIKKYANKAKISLALLHIYPGTRLEEIAHATGKLPPDFSWTDENRDDVFIMPSVQGNVPIFLDTLSWDEVSSFLFEWAAMQKYSLWKRIPKAVKGIRSWKDIVRYGSMLSVYIKRNYLRK